MENILKMGSRERIRESIESALSLSRGDAEKVFDFLVNTFQENTAEFGCVNQTDSQMQALVFNEGHYYINLPKAFLVTIALLLDITLTAGVVSGICGMLGIQTQVFYKLNQHKGEVCLLREYMRDKNIVDSEGFRYLIWNECINNDLECLYRNREQRCCLQISDIEAILQHFRDANIIS